MSPEEVTVQRVFLLGIDGATWKVLDRLIGMGVMPNLERLTCEGARGTLNSTIPYVTPVAWSSILTGVKPSKHGIFGYTFMENREGMVIGFLADRSRIQEPTVFDIFGQLHKKVVSVNMPMTYPPRPEDGVIITGMMTPSKESRFFYPESLMSELQAHGIDYQIDINILRGDKATLHERLDAYLAEGGDRFLKDLHRVTEERMKTVLYLLANKEWDLFQANFVTMDRIPHYLWRSFWEDDEDSPLFKRILDHYAHVDSIIGSIDSQVKGKAMLIICSDHGFGSYDGNFYPLVWLKQKGYYAEIGHEFTPGLMVKRILKTLGLSKKLLRILERSQRTVAKKLIYVGTSNVYWRKTKAYVYGSSGVRINLKGRDQFGIVKPGKEFEDLREEIRQGLLAIEDENGDKIISTVQSLEDLYGSPGPDEAPDLIFQLNDKNHYTAYSAVTDSQVYLEKGYPWRQGDHRREGVVVIAGEGVVPGRVFTADIEDILPTILFVQNLPLSENFDGRVMTAAFAEDFITSRGEPGTRSYARGRVEASEADSGDEVIDRLKGLGYI
jgi:predicted AlkP superfamily phosphohydrolase/phosphomutase